MENISKEAKAIIEREERQKHFSKTQDRLQIEGIVPSTPTLLTRTHGRHFEYIGGACLGFLVGALTLLFNFILFVWLLHVEF